MGSADGQVLRITKTVDNGPDSKRFNLVLVAEGYQQKEIPAFQNRVARFTNHLLTTKPFDTFKYAINVYRIDVASTDSGADDPRACGGSGVVCDTYFDASFCNQNIRRFMSVNESLVRSEVEANILDWRQIVVIVNSSRVGGYGGGIAVTTTSSGWENIALHEIGHSAFRLADEYDYWAGPNSDGNRRNQYVGAEPVEPNVTMNTKWHSIKWGSLIVAGTPIPTTTNPDCSKCDSQGSPVTVGTVGAFEGAYNYHCLVYRPDHDCKMRNVTRPFCAVCQDCIRKELQVFPP